jgi:hypothetical protein
MSLQLSAMFAGASFTGDDEDRGLRDDLTCAEARRPCELVQRWTR